MHEYGVDLSAFQGFSINAHANGKRNPLAMFRNSVRVGAFPKAPMVADPVNLFDGAPDADGAAAVVLTSAPKKSARRIVIAGSSAATDSLALQDRHDPLYLSAVAQSTQRAMAQASVTHADIDLFELHDSFTILSTLVLEAAGFAERGAGWKLTDTIGLDGRLPISTFGGLKSRGNPVGAAGVYQAAEATLQLRGDAAENQVNSARTALTQSLGGLASTAITHVLRAL
jgi:acetyl-CoA C-acetyltransferase